MLSVKQKQKALIESQPWECIERRHHGWTQWLNGWPALGTPGQCVGYASHRDAIHAHSESDTDDGYCTRISDIRDEHWVWPEEIGTKPTRERNGSE